MGGRFYVYEHWRPDRGECFYVGKGHGRRAHDMLRGRNRWHKFVQAKLSALGTAIEVRIIADGLTEEEAFAKEIERIAFWRNDGADLVNLTTGGDGPAGLVHTEESKRIVSEKLRGKVFSPETRAKISAAMKGNKNGLGKIKPPHALAAIIAFHKGRKRTPEQRARMGIAQKARFAKDKG
jgi:hypothetical protein